MLADVETLNVSQTTLLSIDRRLKRMENLLKLVAIDARDTAETVDELQATIDEIFTPDDEGV